jgi:hypothetical protein
VNVNLELEVGRSFRRQPPSPLPSNHFFSIPQRPRLSGVQLYRNNHFDMDAEQDRPAKRQRIGKACKSCRTSKARCEVQPNADACHRCQVLEFVSIELS